MLFKNLSQRNAVVHFLIRNEKDGEEHNLKRGDLRQCADKFSYSPRTVKRIWDRYLDNLSPECVFGLLSRRFQQNRHKGTLVTRCINVDEKVYKDCMINKVLPPIYSKQPGKDPIRIQKGSMKSTKETAKEAAKEKG